MNCVIVQFTGFRSFHEGKRSGMHQQGAVESQETQVELGESDL